MPHDLLRQLTDDFVSLFYPAYCLGCEGALVKGESSLCTRCLLELPQTDYHLEYDNPLRNRLAGRIPLEHVFAFLRFAKNGRTQHLLHALKYKGNPEIGVTLGKVFGQKLLDSGHNLPYHGIVPVPLHITRLRKRGFNQSAKFSEGLAEVLGVPVLEDLLIRKTRTDTQTKKSKLERWANVGDVFQLTDPERIYGRHLLITDDVITTGATIEACANALLRVSQVTLSVASIAVA